MSTIRLSKISIRGLLPIGLSRCYLFQQSPTRRGRGIKETLNDENLFSPKIHILPT